jgi:hypothetical protein
MPDAVELLKEDHEKVKSLFQEFEEAEETEEKDRIVATALNELEVHATVEEEIVYPAIRDTDDDEEHREKVAEAFEEHHAAKLLIGELRNMRSNDERYYAKFKVLSEMVKHHIEEEESEMLPKAEQGGLDVEALGEEITERKESLMEELQSPRSRERNDRKGTSTGNGRASRTGRKPAAKKGSSRKATASSGGSPRDKGRRR